MAHIYQLYRLRQQRESSRRKSTNLLVLELDHLIITPDHLISLIHTCLEQLRQREPLPHHLVSVIGIHELVFVDAVGRVALYAFDGGLAGVECDDLYIVISQHIQDQRAMPRY